MWHFRNGGSDRSSEYFQLSGTSMAAPMVVERRAAASERAPPYTRPGEVPAHEDGIPRSSRRDFVNRPGNRHHIPNRSDLFTIGAGYLDISAALVDKSVPIGSAESPIATYDALSGASHSFKLRRRCGERQPCGEPPRCGARPRCGALLRRLPRRDVGTAAMWGTSTTRLSDAATVATAGER